MFDVVSFGNGSRIVMIRSLTRIGGPRPVRPHGCPRLVRTPHVRRRRFADGCLRSHHARPSPFIGVHRNILFKKPQFPLNVVPGPLLKEVADVGIVVNRLPCRQEIGQSIDPLDRKSPACRRRVRTPAKKGAPSLSEEMKWTACAIFGENLHTACARTRKCEFVTGEELASLVLAHLESCEQCSLRTFSAYRQYCEKCSASMERVQSKKIAQSPSCERYGIVGSHQVRRVGLRMHP